MSFRCKLCFLMAALAMLAPFSRADTAIISLPELTGSYETGWLEPQVAPVWREVSFEVPDNIVAIDQVQLVISGEWQQGIINCLDDPDDQPFVPWISLSMFGDATGSDHWTASIQPPAGVFEDLTDDIGSCCPPGVLDWSLFVGSTIEATLASDIALIAICWVAEDSWGLLTDVHLQIQGSVRTAGSTWGAVKLLYR